MNFATLLTKLSFVNRDNMNVSTYAPNCHLLWNGTHEVECVTVVDDHPDDQCGVAFALVGRDTLECYSDADTYPVMEIKA